MLSLSLLQSEKSEKQVYSCAISTNGLVAAGHSDGTTTLLRPDRVQVLTTHKYPVTALCFTDNHLIIASTDHDIVLYDVGADKVKEKLMIHKGPVRCLCVSKDSSLLISGSSDQTICITNILSNPEVDRYLKLTESDSGMLSGVCISYDNSLVVATATSGTIFLYDTTSPKPVHSHYDAHQMGVNGCDITLEGERNLLCTVGADYLVKLWYVDNYVLTSHKTLTGHTGQVLCCKFHLLGDSELVLFTGSYDKTVVIWNVETGDKIHQSICHSSFIYSISLFEDKLVTCSSDKTVKLWNVCSGKVRSINVVPTASQEKLTDWSSEQVKHWLGRLLPDHAETELVGQDLANMDLDTLMNSIVCDEEKKTRLKQSVSLLRAFDGIPNEFLCPISMEIMTDPVVMTDGHTYERANITEWLCAGNCRSPFTNTTLSTKSIVSNHNLRNIIETVFFLD